MRTEAFIFVSSIRMALIFIKHARNSRHCTAQKKEIFVISLKQEALTSNLGRGNLATVFVCTRLSAASFCYTIIWMILNRSEVEHNYKGTIFFKVRDKLELQKYSTSGISAFDRLRKSSEKAPPLSPSLIFRSPSHRPTWPQFYPENSSLAPSTLAAISVLCLH